MGSNQHELKKIVDELFKYWFYWNLPRLGFFKKKWQGWWILIKTSLEIFKNDDMNMKLAEKHPNSKFL